MTRKVYKGATDLAEEAVENRYRKRIEEVLRQQAADLIERVNFTLERKTDGQCVQCGEITDVMVITAFIYFRDPGTNQMVESVFSIEYCQWCINNLLGFQQEDDVSKMYA